VTLLAFLGPRATFTEQALLSLPESDGAELMPCVGTTAALAAVRNGDADAACVPIENSVEGGVPSVLDSLVTDPPLVIVREAQVAVEFALMARPGMNLADIRSVSSHPHGEAQTRHWLAANLPKAAVLDVPAPPLRPPHRPPGGRWTPRCPRPWRATVHGLKILADRHRGQRGGGHPVRAGPPAVPAAGADRAGPAPRSRPPRTTARCAARHPHRGSPSGVST